MKLDRELTSIRPVLHYVTLSHYHSLFDQQPFYRYIVNSAIVSLATTAVCLLIGSVAGYAFGRMSFPGYLPLLPGVLNISIGPQFALVAPIYHLFREHQMLNTY